MLTEEQKRIATLLRREGMSWNAVAKSVGAATETVRRWLDPEFRRQRIAFDRERYRERQAKQQRERRSDFWHRSEPKPLTEPECAARLREIPRDTRDVTARLCGDPLPGRSALDQRSQTH